MSAQTRRWLQTLIRINHSSHLHHPVDEALLLVRSALLGTGPGDKELVAALEGPSPVHIRAQCTVQVQCMSVLLPQRSRESSQVNGSTQPNYLRHNSRVRLESSSNHLQRTALCAFSLDSPLLVHDEPRSVPPPPDAGTILPVHWCTPGEHVYPPHLDFLGHASPEGTEIDCQHIQSMGE